MALCLYVCACVRSPLGNFYESPYNHVYSDELSLRGVSNDSFLNFSKIPIFECLAAIFVSKYVYFPSIYECCFYCVK